MKSFDVSRFVFLLAAVAFLGNATAQAQCSDLFFSEYIEGWSNNKALEIYNPTDAQIDLSDYRIERYSNGATAAEDNQKVALEGTLMADDVVVVVLDKQDPDGVDFEAPVWEELAAVADLWLCPVYNDNNTMYFNGNDAMVLRQISTNDVVDVFGKIGEDPGTTGWAEVTQNHTLVRKQSVTAGDVNAIDDFGVYDQWDSLEVNTFDQLGFHFCDCGTTSVLETPQRMELDVFPNPASGEVVFVRSNVGFHSLTLRNLAGQE
ncbi:MAG: lamin tail domain-containing protein, partial [Flavobacteriales bacterium]|nr:lamin tail domain-containing protein [Flavobacteriales bacterium]